MNAFQKSLFAIIVATCLLVNIEDGCRILTLLATLSLLSTFISARHADEISD